ncbi:DUF885 family protein [Streptomyces iconiensis]|uniref:DUF885 family protein n=2 Tax=Streptomyces iconiensis TaxID=1384038 RepID=A0ABT6ZSL2_9ACTN|nr:DUF885 family protein [Streptomyces iconiensis]MDJ1132050.1 DUF885 family protein [Streptomyces iconiensis]
MPDSQRTAAAGLFGAAPNEPDAPSRFYVTAPDAALPAAEQALWLASYFNRATLPVIAVHEVAPGHFAHSRAWRRAEGQIRRTLFSEGFSEGRAHYTEQLAFEEGFRGGDPAFGVGVALDGLRRVARLSSALGLHSGELTLDDAAALFGRDAHITGPGAYSKARRGLLDPGYGRYTWGKLAVLDARERARSVSSIACSPRCSPRTRGWTRRAARDLEALALLFAHTGWTPPEDLDHRPRRLLP